MDAPKMNEDILEKFRDDLVQSVDENNKVKLIDFKSPSAFLPHISSTYEALGFPFTLKQWLDLFEADYDEKLKVSRTSRYDFFGKGVGIRTANKFIAWLKKIPVPFVELANKKVMAKVIRSNKVGSNAGAWFSAVNSFNIAYKCSCTDKEHEFEPVFAFIIARGNEEVSFLKKTRNAIKVNAIDKKNFKTAWELQKPIWLECSKVPSSVLITFDKYAENLALAPRDLSEQQTLECIETYCYLCLDFYLELITHYEIGCRFYCCGDSEKTRNELGMISAAISAYATDDNVKTCFDGLLLMFKNTASTISGETSYRKLASFIDIDEVSLSEYGESLTDKQYKQLKDWRRGLNLPSTNKLTSFLNHLDEYTESSSGNLTMIMCRVVMGLDKMIQGMLLQCQRDNCSPANVEPIIKRVLANITDYYNANLQIHLRRIDKAS